MSAKIIKFPERKQEDSIEIEFESYLEKDLILGLKTIRSSIKEFKKISSVPAVDDILSALEIGEKLIKDLIEG